MRAVIAIIVLVLAGCGDPGYVQPSAARVGVPHYGSKPWFENASTSFQNLSTQMSRR